MLNLYFSKCVFLGVDIPHFLDFLDDFILYELLLYRALGISNIIFGLVGWILGHKGSHGGYPYDEILDPHGRSACEMGPAGTNYYVDTLFANIDKIDINIILKFMFSHLVLINIYEYC